MMHIGPYITGQIVEQHGAVTVFAGQSRDGQPILITTIMPTSEESAREIHARFYLIGKLQHPAILPLLDNRQSDDSTFYTVVRRLPTAIPPKGTLKIADVLNMTARVSAALDYAHGQGILHGHLRRLHIVRGLHGEYYLRGFELSVPQDEAHIEGQQQEDVADLARLVYRALVGTEPGARTSRILPRPITTVLRRGVIGDYTTAGEFHEALEAASKAKADSDDKRETTEFAPRKKRTVLMRFVLVALILVLIAVIVVVMLPIP